jgi:hypothetical protein
MSVDAEAGEQRDLMRKIRISFFLEIGPAVFVHEVPGNALAIPRREAWKIRGLDDGIDAQQRRRPGMQMHVRSPGLDRDLQDLIDHGCLFWRNDGALIVVYRQEKPGM